MSLEHRLIIVVRADPVICGHAGEARQLSEAAVERGFTDVRILTWPLEAIAAAGLPTKPLDSIAPYSGSITIERPEAVGDYKVPDGRYLAGMTGRLMEILGDGVPTIVMSMYLHPHLSIVTQAISGARFAGLPVCVQTVAEAVGSDVTNVVRGAVQEGRFGAAAHLLGSYLSQDLPVAVSEHTRTLIIEAAATLDAAYGTDFARACEERVIVSYPAVDAHSLMSIDADAVAGTLERRGLVRDGYVLFLSRLTPAKGVDDLIDGYRRSRCCGVKRLVLAGSGPAVDDLRRKVGADPRITLFTDVDDEDKVGLMHGCSAYVLPSKPRPEFVETFGIALVEKMLIGGQGPILTTDTGGIPEAVGDTAIRIRAGDPESIAAALDDTLTMSPGDRTQQVDRARDYAMRFDRGPVFENLFGRLPGMAEFLEERRGDPSAA